MDFMYEYYNKLISVIILVGTLDDPLKLSVKAALNCALRSAWQRLLQPSPMLTVFHYEPANFEILFH